ncbi:MAG TPA: LuxR C-terminal-related transcriptional regulator [Vicinamibacterales bacterium]|nr:LuxR C-terminal-related transcriptional regulator [Vicinamibacterales bacterium]
MTAITPTGSRRAGDEALARGAWTEARSAFEAALAAEETPEALEGLGTAAWWLDLADIVFDARERAYRLYLARDDRGGAARIAVWLAWDCWAFRGETAVANGWLQRARRHVEGLPACPERAWLELREGSMALFEEGDAERAHAMAAEGIRIAREAGSVDFEMLGRAVQGMALVASGAVAEGMRLLDEVNAAVVAGELTDLVAIGLSCCYLIAACERVRDYDRAVQWCTRLKAFCAKWEFRPLLAVCRTQYASICVWRGTWLEAEQELNAASQELAASRPAMTADALVRLAELRRRQGRLVDASALLEQAGGHGLALLGRAELAFDRGDCRAAAEQAARYLRHVPTHNKTDRAAALDLLVRAMTGTGDRDGAATALAELTGIATLVATAPLRAAASFAAGVVALGDGKADAARQHLEDAVDLFLESGAPFELARARVELAKALAALGRVDAAGDEGRRAMDLFSELKAEHEMARTRTVLDAIAAGPASPPLDSTESRTRSGLTRRELEVLRLVAEGLNNQTIAERLFLSDHTVHRHLANILSKLSVSTRAAAVAQAARRGLLA